MDRRRHVVCPAPAGRLADPARDYTAAAAALQAKAEADEHRHEKGQQDREAVHAAHPGPGRLCVCAYSLRQGGCNVHNSEEHRVELNKHHHLLKRKQQVVILSTFNFAHHNV